MENGEDEIIDAELIEYEEKYKKQTELLLTKIEQREELIGLLKIAKPEKIVELRKVTSHSDGFIEDTEELIEMTENIIRKKREYLVELKNFQ